VSEYFKVITITKRTGGVFILGSAPSKTNHLTVHCDWFPVANKTRERGAPAPGDSVPYSRVEISQESTSKKLIYCSVLVHMQIR
jgi:hypothetical protein